MARPTTQWACIAILALMASAFTVAHMVKSTRSRKLQMDTNGEPVTTNFQASDTNGIVTQHQRSQMDNTEAIARYWGGSRPNRGIYGGGQGSGGTSIGFNNIFPFPGFPFGIIVPQVSTWGQGGGYGGVNNNPGNGGGYGGANNNPGKGANCQCTRNWFPMHYVLTPVYVQPMGPTFLNNMRPYGHGDVAPGPSRN